jgi:hypothetical protein
MRDVPDPLYRCFYHGAGDSASYDPCRLVEWQFIRANDRGRWDDPLDEYRVLYTADSERGALIEVLAPLRPNIRDVEQIAAIDDGDDSTTSAELLRAFQDRATRAMKARLAPRLISRISAQRGPQLYDVLQGASRTEIETTFGLETGSLKTGAFSTSDITLTRAVSRFIYETTGAVGIYSTSAEDGDGYTVSFFETGHNTQTLRIGSGLTFAETHRALDSSHLASALEYLGMFAGPIDPLPSDSGAGATEAAL